MKILILTDPNYGGEGQPRGARVRTCGTFFTFYAWEPKQVSETEFNRIHERALASGLGLEAYDHARHNSGVMAKLNRTGSVDGADLAMQFEAIRSVTKEEVLVADHARLGDLAKALGKFPSREAACRVSAPALREICLVGLGFTVDPPSPPPARPARRRLSDDEV